MASGIWRSTPGQPVSTDLFQVSPGSYAAAAPGLHLDLPATAGDHPIPELRVTWGEASMVLPRMAEGEMLPFEMIFREGLVEQGTSALLAAGEEYRQSFPNLEAMLNTSGYVHLRERQLDAAIAVFKLNVQLFPESSNIYDSLGEAYLNTGHSEEAITNYQHSLELNPGNRNAVEMLERLQSPAL